MESSCEGPQRGYQSLLLIPYAGTAVGPLSAPRYTGGSLLLCPPEQTQQ